MPGSIVQAIWSKWELIFHKLWHVQSIAADGPYMFYVSKQKYLGHPFTVDGVSVNKGDTVIELHMNNDMLIGILRDQKSAVGIAVRLLQEAKRSFPKLATYVSRPEFEGIEVMYGVTFINRSVERFGFQTFPIRRKLLAGMTTWYLKRLFIAVNPKGKQLIHEHPDTLVPRVVAIGRRRFLASFLPNSQGEEVPAEPTSGYVPS